MATNRSSSWSRLWRALRAECEPLHFRLLLAGVIICLMPPLALQRLRTLLYRIAGISIGPRTLVAGRLELIGLGPIASRLRIGADCYVNAPAFFDLTGSVALGNHVTIGHHATFITANHAIGPHRHRAGPMGSLPIVIGSGAWIGAGVTFLPGSMVGEGSVIGAGSLVIGQIPPGVLAVGRPAKVLRKLTDQPAPESVVPSFTTRTSLQLIGRDPRDAHALMHAGSKLRRATPQQRECENPLGELEDAHEDRR
jgi:maltose O-acetyltransferase